MSRIHALHSSDYQTTLEAIEGGIRANTHLALVNLDGNPRRVYLKVFSDHTRGLANEIAGWLIATALGLPAPLRACLIDISGATLSKIHGQPMTSSIAFGVEALPGKSVKYLYKNADADLISGALAKWDNLHKAVAFDDWIANKDRNNGNIIRLGKGKFSLIDHSDILTGPAWSAANLDPALDVRNRLAEMIWNEHPDKEDAGRIADAANAHLAALQHSIAELEDWWKMLLDETELTAARTFLHTRAKNSAERIKARYGLIL